MTTASIDTTDILLFPPNPPPVSVCTTRMRFRRQTKEFHERFVHVVRALQGAPYRYAFGWIGPCDHPLRLDVQLLLRTRFVLALDDYIGGRPHLVDISSFDEEGFEDIVAAPDDFIFRERIFDREDAGEWFDFDVHGSASLFEQILVRMREEQNRLFGVIHSLGSEAGLVIDEQSDAVFPGNIFCLDDGELVPGDAVSETNGSNAPASEGAANRDPVQHVRKCEVVDVLRAARDFLASLFALHRFSNEVCLHHRWP